MLPAGSIAVVRLRCSVGATASLGLVALLSACASVDPAPQGDSPADDASTSTSTSGAGGGGGEVPDPPPDGGVPPEDAAPPAEPCGCFDGNGTYCVDRVVDHAAATGCTPPKAVSHAGDLLSCHGGEWRWDTTCKGGACSGGPSKKDACDAPVYQLPWPCDKERYCTAVNAEVSHHQAGGFSEFAFDFSFPVDSKVRAARGGIVKVMKFETGPGDPCYHGCDGPSSVCSAQCGLKANVLTIKHSDGTVAQYLHLNSPAAGIAKDQRVAQGELIAHSGNTGWSTGPHLHFMVMEVGCTASSCQSIPIQFFDIGMPKKGKSYTSQNCP